MDLSIVVPCYNEEGNLPSFLDAVVAAMEGSPIEYELIFVDDGSVDDSRKILEGFTVDERVSHVTVVEFSRNFGKESALFAGLENATGDAIGIIDADLQQDPVTLLEMYRFLMDHDEYDCIAATQEQRHESAALRFFKRNFYKTFNRMSSTKLVPDASDFRVFRRNVRTAILSMREYFRFSKGIFAWVGFNTCAYSYTPAERLSGESKWSFRRLLKYAFGGIMSFSTVPLRIATGTGFISSIAAVIYFIDVLIEKYALHNTPAGYPTIVCLILLIGGLQLIVLGIIGEYLGQIYIEGKHRPVYIARKVLHGQDGVVEEGSEPEISGFSEAASAFEVPDAKVKASR